MDAEEIHAGGPSITRYLPGCRRLKRTDRPSTELTTHRMASAPIHEPMVANSSLSSASRPGMVRRPDVRRLLGGLRTLDGSRGGVEGPIGPPGERNGGQLGADAELLEDRLDL